MATAVILASEAMHYVHEMVPGLPVNVATIVLLAVFMTLTIVGISESSHVASVIFIIHLGSLVLLLAFGGFYIAMNGIGTLELNFAAPTKGGLDGNADLNPHYLGVFLEYFVPALLVVAIMLGRITILQTCLFLVRSILFFFIHRMTDISQAIRKKIDQINAQQIVFFTRGDNLSNLNNVMLCIQQNEHTNRIKMVTVVKNKADVPPKPRKDLKFLDDAYPNIEIEFVVLIGTFGPELIRELSLKLKIPTNLMFIGSPGTHFIYGLADLGGVRLIV